MDILIKDNFIPKAYQDTLEKLMLGYYFPWFFTPDTIRKRSYDINSAWTDKNTVDCPRFSHEVLTEGEATSNFWPEFRTMLYQTISTFDMELEAVNCKANLNHPIKGLLDTQYCPPHKDSLDPNYIVGIYYVNDADGDTLFFEEPALGGVEITDELKIIKRVAPKKGTFVLFPSSAIHAATPPHTAQTRCVINFGFNKI